MANYLVPRVPGSHQEIKTSGRNQVTAVTLSDSAHVQKLLLNLNTCRAQSNWNKDFLVPAFHFAQTALSLVWSPLTKTT